MPELIPDQQGLFRVVLGHTNSGVDGLMGK